MPVPPYTWQTSDFLTASRLNSELRATRGQPFLANGVAWHAAKPLYKGNWPAINVPGSGTNTPSAFVQSGPSWAVCGDNGAALGARLDPSAKGVISGGAIPHAGGQDGSNGGGLYLVTANFPFNGGASAQDSCFCGIGPRTGGPNMVGAVTPAAGFTTALTPWALDIVSVTGTGWWWNNGPSAMIPYSSITVDGSGIAPRLQGFWASATPANGTQVAALPNPTAWTATTPNLTAAMMNGGTGLQQALQFLNMPPLLRVQATATTATNTTAVPVKYPAATYDTYGGFTSGTTPSYTVPLNGLYLVYTVANWDSFAGTTGFVNSGVTINGTNYFGPTGVSGNGSSCGSSKVQIFSLNAGDTIQHIVSSSSAASTSSVSGEFPTMVVMYLGMLGVPSTLWTTPDPTYLFQAGTPASAMPGVMNAAVQNDLRFLLQRPYLLAYQSTAQTGIAMSTAQIVHCDTLAGLIHAYNGDNYSGWTSGTSNVYTAQRAGWYLAVQETFTAQSSLAVAPNQSAGFTVNPGGSNSSDYYGRTVTRTAGGNGGGASAVGLYYLRVGDTISPFIWSNGTSSTTTATSTSAGNSHFELVWISE